MADITNEMLMIAIQEMATDVKELGERMTNVEADVKEIKQDFKRMNEMFGYLNNQVANTMADVSLLKKEVYTK